MRTGESIREAFNLYGKNPAIILPYLLFGFFNTAVSFFLVNYLKSSLATLRFTSSIEFFLLGQHLTDAVTSLFLQNLLVILLVGFVYLIVDALVKSYTIGMASAIVKGKTATFRDGVSSARRAMAIVAKNIGVGILLIFGSALVFLTSVVLLGKFALIAFIPAAIIYAFILFAITLFASQSIVLENKGAWGGIVSSYFFLRKHMEEAAKLVLFLIFVFVAFQMIKLASIQLFGNFFLSQTLQLVRIAENLLLGYIIMRPFFVILKTHFYIKNSKALGKKE